jgi:hypothetical protein
VVSEETAMRVGAVLVVAAAVGACLTACTEEVVCPEGQVACGGACATLTVDPANCGACGTTCATGEACRAGACTDCASACGDGQTCEHGVCRADLYVACASTDEVVGVSRSLALSGPPRPVDDGPVALAWLGDRVWAAHGYTTPTLVGFTPGVAGDLRWVLGGDYLTGLRAGADGILYVASHPGTLVAVHPEQGVKDEIALGLPGYEQNPRGVALAGVRAVVALAGDALTPTWAEGQAIALVETTQSLDCTTLPCLSVIRKLGLDVPAAEGVVGAYDAPGFPFPSGAAAVGTRAFVTLGNLGDSGGYYGTPAGHGRLAAFDAFSSGDPTFIDLGADCVNPGAIAVSGSTLLVACGVYDDCFASGTGHVIPVDVGGAVPVVLPAIPVPVVPVSVAACGADLYVGDMCSGTVARVPATGEPTSQAICGGSSPYVPDLLCAGATP